MNSTEMLCKNREDIRNEIMLYMIGDLLGIATKKMRGITLNYNNSLLEVNTFFDNELTEEEEEEMQTMDTRLITSAYPYLYNSKGEVILNIDKFGLNLIVIPADIDISDKEGNLGWIFLRKEYS